MQGVISMIFYFTGTGNSLYVAKNIGESNNEALVSIAEVMNSPKANYEFDLKDNEAIGFVFPIYSWGPPKMVIQFIEKFKLNNYNNHYMFAIATCGKNIGNSMELLDFHLKKKNLALKSGFSIVMPNNFIGLGNVDTPSAESKKLSEAEVTLKHINGIIKDRKVDVYETAKGAVPGLLTSMINPMFNKKATSPKKFYTNDKCIACGLCSLVCNTQTIKVLSKPTWGTECAQCMACLHLCPTEAIQFSKGSEKKGRYKNPNISVDELKLKL